MLGQANVSSPERKGAEPCQELVVPKEEKEYRRDASAGLCFW